MAADLIPLMVVSVSRSVCHYSVTRRVCVPPGLVTTIIADSCAVEKIDDRIH